MGSNALLGSLLFHLNLSYSAIEVAQRGTVVRRCYRPLLELAERLPWIRIGIEASGHTLERIHELDPEWISTLRELISAGRVEFVGSGDTQLIGPLVPGEVNAWNQRLGQETYARFLGERPTLALVNEMAWSQGIIDAYVDAGYRTLVMEWNNPRRAHPEWDEEWRYGAVGTSSPTGTDVEVLWADAVAFQKLQRAVAGDLSTEEYVDWVTGHAGRAPRHLCLYANDAEVFDFRPGRFEAEPPLATGSDSTSEWERMEAILTALHDAGVEFALPTAVADDERFRHRANVVLNAATDPIPVKKQPKYNATRWALSGRDDVRINARCFERARRLADPERGNGDPEAWRRLCRAWASDVRTHLTESRWEDYLREGAGEARAEDLLEQRVEPLTHRRVTREGDRIQVETDDVRITLLPRRGLAIESLAFLSTGETPLCGTLPHGHFDDIDWAADFFTGHAVLDIPAHRRVTDLGRTEPTIEKRDDCIELSVLSETPLGQLRKTVSVARDSVELTYAFSGWGERIPCSLRAGFVTLLPDGLDEDLWITCSNGGAEERFALHGEIDHGASASPLVSARAAFGASDGRLLLDDGHTGIELAWPNHESAALPLLTSRRIRGERFVRIAFSLAEIDETHRPGSELTDFSFTLRGKRIAA